MRFMLVYTVPGSTEEHKEEYNKAVANPHEWGKNIISFFNDTLKPHEKPRTFVRIEPLVEKLKRDGTLKNPPMVEHHFTKQNGVTIIEKNKRPYDIYKCKCGVTGKRFGLDEHIVKDNQYRAKRYISCSIKRLE